MAKKRRAKKLRVAFIGTGMISELHMIALAGMDDVEMVAFADISKAALEERSARFGVSDCFTDYNEMLRKVKPDAVSVCTPNGVHAASTIAALRAGAHVIVEKPMAMNPREAQAMITAAKKHRRKLVIGFQQ
ncbi:MAG: Gfo/Idh/MocA family oxidoreductase, partial [Candidatus Latescibacteria bacterium]|nr:Gfo/Idh/MocA family oxidoreductase [Candidatus Latescibacterota bacterium]